jgi:hypothetical protein
VKSEKVINWENGSIIFGESGKFQSKWKPMEAKRSNWRHFLDIENELHTFGIKKND